MNYVSNVREKKSSSIIKNIFFPDRFINHMKPEEQYQDINMDANSIAQMVSSLNDNKIIELKNFNINNNT